MSLLLSLLANKFVMGAGAALLAIVGAFLRGRASGAAKERRKTEQERQRARDIADEVDSDIGALSPEQRRERLKEWSE